MLRRTRRNANTIRGAAPDVTIGCPAAVRAGARPYHSALGAEQGDLSDEGHNLSAHVCKLLGGYSALPLSVSGAPVQAFYLIGEDNTLRCTGDQNLKEVW